MYDGLAHPLEDPASIESSLVRQSQFEDGDEVLQPMQRRLHKGKTKKQHDAVDDDDVNHGNDDDAVESPAEATLEHEQEIEFLENKQKADDALQKKKAKKLRKREKRMHELYADPGIASETVHGLMIDAGSTGSRMHVFEWEPRILRSDAEVDQAVSGNKFSFPGTESRWTDRLRPGLASFASIQDDAELQAAIMEYLDPLVGFAKTILHSKVKQQPEYPIFLRATAGMRMLDATDRSRIMNAVRQVFHNKTFCPFYFVDEQARVLSGEEEAIFDWTGVNFLLGDLINESHGSGAVVEPRLTHGALDLGGASTQIGFYEPNEDIMANLFKLQIGQGKHWNLYAHSFLFYGINEAIDRFHANLIGNKTAAQRLVNGVTNPCLAVGGQTQVRTQIHLSESGVESWMTMKNTSSTGTGDYYHATLKNDEADVDRCFQLAKDLLHLEKNDWCNFAHKGDCSFAGIYQPTLPVQGTGNFGEFVAFSNYFHIWNFLQLPERATIAELEQATRFVCSLSYAELVAYNDGNLNGGVTDDELNTYCFRSAYAYELLRSGYRFRNNDTIRVTDVINGQKVGWALGAMLYEINLMPWKYNLKHLPTVDVQEVGKMNFESTAGYVLGVIILFTIMSVLCILRGHSNRQQYLSLPSNGEDEETPLCKKPHRQETKNYDTESSGSP